MALGAIGGYVGNSEHRARRMPPGKCRAELVGAKDVKFDMVFDMVLSNCGGPLFSDMVFFGDKRGFATSASPHSFAPYKMENVI